MSAPEREVRDLWQRAGDSLTAAEKLLADRFPDFAASRAYYAAFYAASAALAADGKTFASHRGVLSHIHKDFVNEGRLAKEAGRILSALFDVRNLGDYGGSAHVSQPQAERAVADARRFLHAVRPLLPDDL